MNEEREKNEPAGQTYAAPICSALHLAKQFHENYERLAPSFGY